MGTFIILFKIMANLAKRLIPLFETVPPVTKTVGGIILPESAQSKLNEFKVIAVGNGRRAMDGKVIPPVVKEGNSVLVSEVYGGTEVKVDDKTYHIYREDDIIGILE